MPFLKVVALKSNHILWQILIIFIKSVVVILLLWGRLSLMMIKCKATIMIKFLYNHLNVMYVFFKNS